MEFGSLLRDCPVVLAPMVGILDGALRAAFRKHGCPLSCIGSIDAGAVARDGTGRLINIFGKVEEVYEGERPLWVQLIGNDEDALAHALRVLAHRADIFDFNLGCPLKSITERGWGASLLERPKDALRLINRASKSTAKPLTAKIRLPSGDCRDSLIEFARELEKAGVTALTIHGRTPEQGYVGEVDWLIIRAVKEALKIPVIGGGGIRTPKEAVKRLKESGCDAVMVGRSAIRNPLFFEECREFLQGTYRRKSYLGGLVRFAESFAAESAALHPARRAPSVLGKFLYLLMLNLRVETFRLRHRGAIGMGNG